MVFSELCILATCFLSLIDKQEFSLGEELKDLQSSRKRSAEEHPEGK